MASVGETTVQDGLIEREDGPRVFNVGVGTFLIGLTGLLAVMICIAGCGTRAPGIMVLAGLGLFLLVTLFLFIAPRQSPYRQADEVETLTTTFYIGEGLMAFAMVVGVGMAAAGLTIFEAAAEKRAVVISPSRRGR